jgi:hypothetical protein
MAAWISGTLGPSLSGFSAVPQTGTSSSLAMRASFIALATTRLLSKMEGIRRDW